MFEVRTASAGRSDAGATGSATISVRALGKRYQLGATLSHDTLRDSLASAARRLLGRPPPARAAAAENAIWALKDVSFDIAHGEVVGVIGRNGAGKSTLLKILSRITEPTAGEVRVRGRIASLLEVGTGFHPELSGRENIYLNGAILGMRRAEIGRKFDEIVDFSGVGKFIDTPVKRYSSGMYVRLAFAVAAHLEPEILLVDEVLAVGDAEFQKCCLGKMRDVAGAGRTVLFVSHNMFAIRNLCSRCLHMSAGSLAMDGATDAVVEGYILAGGKRLGAVSWDDVTAAPGDDRVRLRGVWVTEGASPAAAGTIAIDQDFRLHVEYENLVEGERRRVFVHIHNAMGIWVISSGNLPSLTPAPDPLYALPLSQGRYRATCEIPGGLLNDGGYSVSVFITDGNIRNVLIGERDVLSFMIEDHGYMRSEYTGPWPTVIRPKLAWETEACR